MKEKLFEEMHSIMFPPLMQALLLSPSVLAADSGFKAQKNGLIAKKTC